MTEIDETFKPQTFAELRAADPWTSAQYQTYYEKLLPVLDGFYNVEGVGYRPLVMMNNIAHILEKGEIYREQRCKFNKEKHRHYLVKYDGKLAGWRCPHNLVQRGGSEKAKINAVLDRYRIQPDVLWTIDNLIKKPATLGKARSIYFYPLIRDSAKKNVGFQSNWIECLATNFIVDIDITNKSTDGLFIKEDKWGHSRYDVSYQMLSEICEVLDNLGIKYRLQSSGNGWYIHMERINVNMNIDKYEVLYADSDKVVKHRKKQTDGSYANEYVTVKKDAIFWKRAVESFKEFKREYIQPVILKYQKYFEPDMIEEPFPHKYVKTPYSLHQRFDYAAKPTNLDELNDLSAKEFSTLCIPSYISGMRNDMFFNEWTKHNDSGKSGTALIEELNRQWNTIEVKKPEVARHVERRAGSDVLGFYSTGDRYGVRFTTDRKIKATFKDGKLLTLSDVIDEKDKKG